MVHTGEGCHVTVSWDGARVRLEAEDTEGGLFPQRAPVDLVEESGRGLQLVDGLAQAWGFRPTTGGKSVWFEVGGCSPSPSGLSPVACEGNPCWGVHSGRRHVPNQETACSAAPRPCHYHLTTDHLTLDARARSQE